MNHVRTSRAHGHFMAGLMQFANDARGTILQATRDPYRLARVATHAALAPARILWSSQPTAGRESDPAVAGPAEQHGARPDWHLHRDPARQPRPGAPLAIRHPLLGHAVPP
jgi:hypothetical protein